MKINDEIMCAYFKFLDPLESIISARYDKKSRIIIVMNQLENINYYINFNIGTGIYQPFYPERL